MQEIKDLKIMLLGIAVILFVIVLHLFLQNGLITDLFALVGLFFVFLGYREMKDDKKSED